MVTEAEFLLVFCQCCGCQVVEFDCPVGPCFGGQCLQQNVSGVVGWRVDRTELRTQVVLSITIIIVTYSVNTQPHTQLTKHNTQIIRLTQIWSWLGMLQTRFEYRQVCDSEIYRLTHIGKYQKIITCKFTIGQYRSFVNVAQHSTYSLTLTAVQLLCLVIHSYQELCSLLHL